METEDEQVENLKKWLRENGAAIVAGIVIGVGGLFGYRGWIDYQENQAMAASTHYEQMLSSLQGDNTAQLQESFAALESEFNDTEYLQLGRLLMARFHVEQQEFDQAAAQLEQVVGTVGSSALGMMARTRLADIQIQLEQYDAALATLSFDFPGNFLARVEELRGDAHYFKGERQQAAEAYRKAQAAIPGPASREFLQQKIQDLGI